MGPDEKTASKTRVQSIESEVNREAARGSIEMRSKSAITLPNGTTEPTELCTGGAETFAGAGERGIMTVYEPENWSKATVEEGGRYRAGWSTNPDPEGE